MQVSFASVQRLYNNGHLKRAHKELNQMSDEYLRNATLEEKIQFFLLQSTVTLRLSLLADAKRYIQENLRLLEQFDHSNPNYYKYLLETGLNLQKIEYWLCKYREAISINAILIQLLDQHMPNSVNERCEVLAQMGNTYRAWCQYNLAQECIDKAYQLIQGHPNVDRLVVSNVLFVKARQCMDTELPQQGIELTKQCIEMRQEYYKRTNPNHIDISLAHELMGKQYFSIGSVSESEKYHNLAYQNKMNVLGEYNFETIDSINERGRIMLSKKKDEAAKHYFSRLGAVSLDLLGPVNQYEALSYNNLGCVYYNEKNYEESIANHQKALEMYTILCGKDHYKLVFALNQMAYANKALGRNMAAISLWKRSISILIKVNGPPTEKNIKNMTQQIQQSLSNLEE